MLEQEKHSGGPTLSSSASQDAESSAPNAKTRATGIEVWRAIMDGVSRCPDLCKRQFAVQVLVCIFDIQRISPEALDGALQQASRLYNVWSRRGTDAGCLGYATSLPVSEHMSLSLTLAVGYN